MSVLASETIERPVRRMDERAHHVARRRENVSKAAADPQADPQGLLEFGCECSRSDCERSVKVPLYVYRRILDSGTQCLLQAGHHGFPTYRTIVSVGLMRIEERA
jgi:hypothetical protein